MRKFGKRALLALILTMLAPLFLARGEERPFLVAEEPPERSTITLTFMGDCILGSEDKDRGKPQSFDSLVGEKGMAWPLSGLAELFSQDDYTLVNLEGVLKQDSSHKAPNRLHNFRGPADFARILALGSVEGVNLANNHHDDYQRAGRESTLAALREAGIRFSGYGHLDVFEKDGVRVGFAGIRETIWHQGRRQMTADIQALRDKGCEFIVYSCHFGQEYAENHSQIQREMARADGGAGADLVIGHHPHVVQGVEGHAGGTILYSLGNGVFGGNLHLSEFDGLVVQARLDFRYGYFAGGSLRLIPILTTGAAPENDFRPIIAQGEDALRILARVQADSGVPLAFEMPLPLPEALPDEVSDVAPENMPLVEKPLESP